MENAANVSGEPKQTNQITNSNNNPSPEKKRVEIRTINMEKQKVIDKSGEFILNHLYKHKKSINQIRKESSNKIEESELNKHRESVEINIGEEDLINQLNHVMTQKEEESIKKALSNHFVFKNITSDVLNLVMNELIFCPFKKDTIVYQEGDEGNFFYIIASGSVEATEKGKFKKKYGIWECFGELSLITQNKREETIKCLEDVSVFTIDGISFRDIQNRINEKILKERFNFLISRSDIILTIFLNIAHGGTLVDADRLSR